MTFTRTDGSNGANPLRSTRITVDAWDANPVMSRELLDTVAPYDPLWGFGIERKPGEFTLILHNGWARYRIVGVTKALDLRCELVASHLE